MGYAAAASPASASTRDAKKKRGNRSLAKLKQCKLNARRELWLSQGMEKFSCVPNGATAASASSRSQQPPRKGEGREGEEEVSAPAACYDARVADEAYRAACAALGAGRADAAVRSLRVALLSCPPKKAAAVAKLRSMLAIASAQQHKQQHQAQQQQQQQSRK